MSIHLFRVIVPVSDIDAAAKFYAHVLGMPGVRVLGRSALLRLRRDDPRVLRFAGRRQPPEHAQSRAHLLRGRRSRSRSRADEVRRLHQARRRDQNAPVDRAIVLRRRSVRQQAVLRRRANKVHRHARAVGRNASAIRKLTEPPRASRWPSCAPAALSASASLATLCAKSIVEIFR